MTTETDTTVITISQHNLRPGDIITRTRDLTTWKVTHVTATTITVTTVHDTFPALWGEWDRELFRTAVQENAYTIHRPIANNHHRH